MSFELYLSKRLHRQKQFGSFVPFCLDTYTLPVCTTKVYEKDDDRHLYSAVGLDFRSYIDETGTLSISETQYFAIPWKEGVMLQSKDEPDGLVYVYSEFAKIDAVADTMNANGTMLYDLLLCGYQFVCANAGALLMHASAVMYRGEAILFCGVSGAGKSTQAQAWIKYYGAEPINFDHPCIVWQGDVPYACGTPWGGKEKFCQPVSAPVRAIVFIHKNEHSTVRELRKGEAFSLLMLNNALPHVRYDLDEKLMNTVERLVKCVPVYHQEGTLTREAPDTLHRVLYGAEE